ncbi:hypothetical protein SKAU_G00022870 [Synaphobranchus kaupii]|uniref:Uncharacterized protein n=1 Tax=Synaphobranchus kaupii TaxID=118154 RepID=A0A9Q1JET8_SYNKA|nr:hypothetical protein SKAU_G00022870 [Synaphobranchus kaupii]
MSMTQPKSNCRLVDASIQKNISFEGKPVTPTSWNGGFAEVFSLRDQLKQAEERASQVQRECDGLKAELQELQGLYDCSQRERAELESELQHYREELDRLMGRKAQVPLLGNLTSHFTSKCELQLGGGPWNDCNSGPDLVLVVGALIVERKRGVRETGLQCWWLPWQLLCC